MSTLASMLVNAVRSAARYGPVHVPGLDRKFHVQAMFNPCHSANCWFMRNRMR